MKVPTLLCTLRRTTSHWRRDNPCCIWVDAPLLSHCRLATLSSTIACYRDRRPFSSCPALEDHDSTTTAALAHLISGEPIHTQRQLREMFEALTIRDRRKWSIIANGRGLERSFRFKTFKSAWTFMQHVSTASKERKHHPSWSNAFDRVFVRWTTHEPPGLSTLDLGMAELCDRFGRKPECCEIDEEQGIRLAKPGEEVRTVAEELRNVLGKVEKSSGEGGHQVEIKERERGIAVGKQKEEEEDDEKNKEMEQEKERQRREEKHIEKENKRRRREGKHMEMEKQKERRKKTEKEEIEKVENEEGAEGSVAGIGGQPS